MFIPRANIDQMNTSEVAEKRIVILSGAGLDAPSGIQTFRGEGGLWNGSKIEDICNELVWKENIKLFHEFYNERRVHLGNVNPNPAHYAIKKIIDKYGKENVYNITQNVSDLFERIDCETLHLHGELTKMSCEECGNIWDIKYNTFDVEKDICPECHSSKAIRPNIVLFNGPAPMYAYLKRAIDYLNNPDSIIVVIGTMGNVVPINRYIKNKPCKKILCNIEPSIDLPESMFDDIYYESVDTAILKIEKQIENYWDSL